jgi:pyruvate/2-oxoglutarate dehydrogenase complex dihydrolipoamide acyltransferase (E2) component
MQPSQWDLAEPRDLEAAASDAGEGAPRGQAGSPAIPNASPLEVGATSLGDLAALLEEPATEPAAAASDPPAAVGDGPRSEAMFAEGRRQGLLEAAREVRKLAARRRVALSDLSRLEERLESLANRRPEGPEDPT